MGTDPLWAFKVKYNVRSKIRRALPVVDVTTALPTALAGAYFFLLKRLGLHEMPLNRRALDAIGVWPIRRHYYEPYFDAGMLRAPLDECRDLPGLDLGTARAVELMTRLAWCREEPLCGPVQAAGGMEYRPENNTFGLPDAAVLYGMVRTSKPSRIIEVGSGNSTLVVLQALSLNRQEGHECEHLCIEPFEMPWLEQSGAQIVRSKVEEVDLSIFHRLQSGDLLFIDNSHMIRPQGDVVTVVQRILPRLNPGVIVHVHDLFTPRDYPAKWVVGDRLLWNEQYLVEAFLTDNDRFEVLLPVNQLWNDFRESFRTLRSQTVEGEWIAPTSFWFRRKGEEPHSRLDAIPA